MADNRQTLATTKALRERYTIRLEPWRRAAYQLAAKRDGRNLANWMRHILDAAAEAALTK
jgi:hypothetical protein